MKQSVGEGVVDRAASSHTNSAVRLHSYARGRAPQAANHWHGSSRFPTTNFLGAEGTAQLFNNVQRSSFRLLSVSLLMVIVLPGSVSDGPA